MSNINKPQKPQKQTWWGDFKAAWKRATPGQRFGALLIVGILLALIILLLSLVAPDAPMEAEPLGESKVGSIGGAIETDKSLAVIEDTESELGQKLIQAEQARVAYDAQQGRSSIQSLVVNNEPSPFDHPGAQALTTPTPVPNSSQATPPPPIQRKDVFAPTQVTTRTASENWPIQQTQSEINSGPSTLETMANDPFAGFGSPEEYMAALQQAMDSTADHIGKTTKEYQDQRTSMSSGITLVAATNQPQNAAPSLQSAHNQRSEIPTPSKVDSAQTARPPILLNPGDSLPVYIPYEVDSRVPGPFIAIALTGKLKDARLRCEFSDTGDFIVPTCTEMTLNGGKHPIEAMVINPKTFGRVIDQDIDDDTFLKAIAKFGSNALEVFGAAKLAQGITRVEDSDANTVTTENNQSDRQIVLGSLAAGLGDLSSSAEAYYQQASVKTIPANTQMILVMTSPIPDVFGVNERQTKGYTR